MSDEGFGATRHEAEKAIWGASKIAWSDKIWRYFGYEKDFFVTSFVLRGRSS